MKKIALITGASSGIGKEIVKQLLNDNMDVYGASRSLDKMQDIKKLGAKILPIDLTDDKSIQEAVKLIIKENDRIDILINCAGYGLFGAIEDIPLNDARKQFEVNLFGLGRLTQLIIPYMRSNKFGKIVNISSAAGKMYSPLGGWYTASKFALEGFSDCLRIETKPFGIDVIIIEPGTINTGFDKIAFDTLLKYSENGAYRKLAKNSVILMKSNFSNKKSSQPKCIAKKVSKVIMIKKPKTRYSVGHRSKLAINVRKWLPDKFLDKMILKRINRD